jgi:hypothetical protein
MGSPIVKLDGKYLIWSTVSDSPASFGMTEDELIAYVREEDGRRGVEELASRLARVDAKGTSALQRESADDTIWLNRAGPRETPLHREEIIEFYIRRKTDPTPAALAAFRKGLKRCGRECPARPDKDGCASMCERCWGTDYVRPSSPNRSKE